MTEKARQPAGRPLVDVEAFPCNNLRIAIARLAGDDHEPFDHIHEQMLDRLYFLDEAGRQERVVQRGREG